ncbi:hypothetical protein [Akkermansia muciniphila]|uniref:hypothetical protein n=1 Tax=Akkermansia muciniphila TaxID=239935 RepID=UPI001BFF1CD1|nr:hypothetical protein [Akkermansia muciniphila]MBT8778686.1 hypothetical protein [Akkermansia muciniphila]
MKFAPRLYLLTCLGLASLGWFCGGASATELPVKYIFELSDEPVKVRPGKIDTKSVFFPKYARGTSPEALKRQAALFHSQIRHTAPKSSPAIDIHMNDDRMERDGNALSGYEFHHTDDRKETVITTEPPDEEIWLNDGDPDSPFFHTPRSATNTEIREISSPSDVWPAWNEAEVNLNMNLQESAPRPFVIQPAPSGAIRTIIKSFNGAVFEADAQPMHPVWDQLPPGYVPIPALPAYQPTVLRKLQ